MKVDALVDATCIDEKNLYHCLDVLEEISKSCKFTIQSLFKFNLALEKYNVSKMF